MNNEEYINKAVEPLLKMYTKIENDLLVMIAEHFKINDEFLNSDYWRIKKLEEIGLFNREVIEYLAQYSDVTKEEILKALEDIGYNVFDIQKLENAFENGSLKINPNTLLENYTIQNIINNAYDEVSNRFIELSRKIQDSTREAYLDIVEQGYLKTGMGTHSYQEAIRESINELGNKGIRTLTYRTVDENDNVVGIRSYDIESTVRRDILTATRQLSNNINQSVVEELECKYIYLSEHVRCRPSHFDWQGTIIKYDDLIDVTHYGEVDGLAGINCAHYFEAYFGDARGDELKSISKEDATEQYNLSQQQRYLERGVRKWKRKVEMFKANGDTDAYNKSRSKVKKWQNRLSNFTKNNDLRRDYTREYVSQRYPNWYINLNQDEKNAISRYFGGESYTLNESLRTNQELDEEQQKLSDNLSSALNKIPNTKGVFNRSLFFYDENSKNNFIQSMKEDVITFSSFTSVSKEIYDNTDDVRLVIHTKTAKDLSKLNIREKELLIDKSKNFVLLNKWAEDGKIFYELEELQ